MNVLLIDVDSKMPNLALMKISGYHKKKGDRVGFNIQKPDKVSISCVFKENKSKALGIVRMFNSNVEIGGYGVNDIQLPYEVEHTMPDYSLYGIHYSIGFTSRGCIRKCPWCIVPKKEGAIREHAPIDEFYNFEWGKLVLWDNNFLASPKWHSKLHEIIVRKIRVSFNQGLDIRFVNEEVAGMLSQTNYSDVRFKSRRLYFSFDRSNIEGKVLEGIQNLLDAGVKPHHLMFYILTGFNVKAEDYTLDYFYSHDYARFELLHKMGILVFPMVYDNRKDIPILKKFQKWAIRRYYKVCSFEEYRPAKPILESLRV